LQILFAEALAMANKKKSNRDLPDAIEDFKARQDYTHNPGKFAGNYRNNSPAMVMGRSPLFMVILGTMGAIAVLIALISLDFTWFQLMYYVPGLAVSALLIFGGVGRSRAQNKK
jgi:hypothetical protein